MYLTPLKSRLDSTIYEPQTPISFSKELKNVLNERNLLTAKTRKRVCSMLDSPSERNGIDKRRQFRIQAIQEILNSEQTYLHQLERLMNFFIIPLKERGLINESSHSMLFGQIEMIYNLNGELFKELNDNLENVGSAFLKMAPFFKLYSVYAFDYKNALLVLQELTNKNIIFRRFLEDTESRPEVQQKLNSLMIVPIQRVPRYKLLLEQVLLYTSPADLDFKILKESVKQIENTVSHMNTVIEDQEITQVLLNLQNSLVNRTPNIVIPSRRIIKEGVLQKVTRNGSQIKRYCILMSDIFMYCKMLKDRVKDTLVENSLECCCIFPLKKCKVYELFPGNFKISCHGDGLILCTSDLHLGQSWMRTIKDSIEIHIEGRKTLRKASSKRTPMRKKELKKFDVNYVLSSSKRKFDYESVLRCKSSGESEDENDTEISCFNIPDIFKRKYENNVSKAANNTEIVQSNLELLPPMKKPDNFVFKVPDPPQPNRMSKLKLLWQSNEKNTIKNSLANQEKNRRPSYRQDDTSTEDADFDPTYGFANRLSVTKSYFRASNVDSTIPKSITHTDYLLQITPDGGTPLMDVLYPLRTSGGSSNSENGWLHRHNEMSGDKENTVCHLNRNIAAELGETELEVPMKKVKFTNGPMKHLISGSRKSTEKPQPFEFSLAPETKKIPDSLRQRLRGFFSRLF